MTMVIDAGTVPARRRLALPSAGVVLMIVFAGIVLAGLVLGTHSGAYVNGAEFVAGP